MTSIISHRGVHKNFDDITENTIPAFKNAVDLGIKNIELDVHLTKDDQWLIHHNFNLKDGTSIAENNLDELLIIADNLNFRLDTLESVLKSFPELNINVECKPKSYDAGYKLANFLDDSKRLHNTNISAFSSQALRGARKANSDIRLSQLDLAFLLINWKKLNEEINLYSINPFFVFTRKNLVTKAHKNDIEVHIWTVNKEKVMLKMKKRGVDGIITDFPDIAQSVLI